jgi:two-component system, OmpR family, KDP operon response regulator KdpE
MSAARVLLVDEEPHVVRGLEIMLRGVGYMVEAAESRLDVLARVVACPPDALVLDLVLPDGRGVELCREIRRISGLPILVLTAVSDERERIRALDAGADDFVTRPFGRTELLERLGALTRRPGNTDGHGRFEVGELVIDFADRSVSRAGEHIHLGRLQFELVSVLARSRGRLVRDRQLLHALWGPGCVPETRELRVLVAEIRAKLERDPSRPEYVITELGVGYRFRGLAAAREGVLR